jgi:hypothetical protein
MTELAALHPEIEGLLREVAADPQSNLLRLPRTGLRHSLRRAELPERAPTTGLRPAERELLRTCRHEVAYLLLLACYRQQITSPQNRYLVYSVRSNADIADDIDLKWMRIAREKLGIVSDAKLTRSLSLLARCTSGDGQAWPTVFELAAASARLVPSTMARNYAALDLILSDKASTGARMLQDLHYDAPAFQVMAACNRVFGLEKSGRLDLAYEALVSSEWSDIGLLPQAFFGACVAAQLGSLTETDRWASELRALAPTRHNLDMLMRGLRERKAIGSWSPTPCALAALNHASRVVGGPVEEIRNAYL